MIKGILYNIIIFCENFMLRKQSHKQPVPKAFVCPLSKKIMEDPVMTSDGYTFDRFAIEAWWKKGNLTNPITAMEIKNTQLAPNRALKSLIQEHKKQKRKIQKQNSQKYWTVIAIIQKSNSLKNLSKGLSIQKKKKRTPKIHIDDDKESDKYKEVISLNLTDQSIRINNPYCEQPITKQNDEPNPEKQSPKKKKRSQSLHEKNQAVVISFLEQTIQQFQQRWDEFNSETLDWLKDFRNCQATLPSFKKYKNGYYKGELEGKEHHGYGIMVFKDGNTEYGEWKNGMLHGKAAQYIEKPSRLHAGTFEADALNGLGEIRDTKLNKSIYRGYFQNNLKHGFGIEFDPKNQKTYKGYFVKGKKEGKGREYNYLGDFFQGQWIEDLKHGRGVRVKKDEQFEEYWVKGKEMNGQQPTSPQRVKRASCGCSHY